MKTVPLIRPSECGVTVVWLGLFMGSLAVEPEFIPGALTGFLEPIPYDRGGRALVCLNLICQALQTPMGDPILFEDWMEGWGRNVRENWGRYIKQIKKNFKIDKFKKK